MQNALSPAEYHIVQGVFRSLAQADWFDRSEENEKECARLVLLMYSNGIGDALQLHEVCEPRARERFAKPQ